MPPIFAAAPQSIPSRTPANDRSPRLWLTALDRRASPRNSSAESSSRNLTADGMARILSRQRRQKIRPKRTPLGVTQKRRGVSRSGSRQNPPAMPSASTIIPCQLAVPFSQSIFECRLRHPAHVREIVLELHPIVLARLHLPERADVHDKPRIDVSGQRSIERERVATHLRVPWPFLSHGNPQRR